jgi:hypothetical protein
MIGVRHKPFATLFCLALLPKLRSEKLSLILDRRYRCRLAFPFRLRDIEGIIPERSTNRGSFRVYCP